MILRNLLPFLILSASMNIYSSNLIPLDEFVKKNDTGDASILEYVSKRCSAHNLAMTGWTTEGDGVYDVAMENYIFWYTNALLFRTIKFPNQDQEIAAKNIIDSVINISKEIDNVMKNSQDFRGSIWEGNSFTNDLTLCKGFAESINNLE